MSTWRDELQEAIKSKGERDAEEAARRKKRLEEALKVAEEALGLANEGMTFVHEQLASKQQACSLERAGDTIGLSFHGQTLSVELDRGEAILKVTSNSARPKEFDFAKDRHIAPKDVEEYVGRRAVELARAAQKVAPW